MLAAGDSLRAVKTPTSRIQRTQRSIRAARLQLVAAQEATPELAPELGDAITSALAAEKKSARLLREGLEMK